MKKIYLYLPFIAILTSCIYTDSLSDQKIRVIGNIYLSRTEDGLDGFKLTNKETENVHNVIIGEKIIKLLYDKSNIYATSIYSTDTSYYRIQYNDSIEYFIPKLVDKKTFIKLTTKHSDLNEIDIPE